MHAIRQLIRDVNKTHRGLGEMIAINLIGAKSKRCILNISPSGCGKSTATEETGYVLGDRCKRYDSLTLSGLCKLRDELTGFTGHVIIDDLGAEKSEWSRTSTVSTLAHLVMQHHVRKITQTTTVEITDFNGSASLNIQPVMMQSIVRDDDWIAVIRDKVLRHYHLLRPIKPQRGLPTIHFNWGINIDSVEEPKETGILWHQLIVYGLSQWSFGRCKTHIPMMLKALAALDDRKKCIKEDYKILGKLMMNMQLERFIIESLGFESGRLFNNNLVCLLVELASWGQPTIETIAEDYKIHPRTVESLAATCGEWCAISSDKPKRLIPTEQTTTILQKIGVNQKW